MFPIVGFGASCGRAFKLTYRDGQADDYDDEDQDGDEDKKDKDDDK